MWDIFHSATVSHDKHGGQQATSAMPYNLLPETTCNHECIKIYTKSSQQQTAYQHECSEMRLQSHSQMLPRSLDSFETAVVVASLACVRFLRQALQDHPP